MGGQEGALPSSVWLQKLNLGFCEGTTNSNMATKMATVASEAYLGGEHTEDEAAQPQWPSCYQPAPCLNALHEEQAQLGMKTGAPETNISSGVVNCILLGNQGTPSLVLALPPRWGDPEQLTSLSQPVLRQEGPQEYLFGFVMKIGEKHTSHDTDRALLNSTTKLRRAIEGTAEGRTYFVSPSAQATDSQPGMKPGSRENHRLTSRRKQSRTLTSAKEKGPSFLYSSRSTS